MGCSRITNEKKNENTILLWASKRLPCWNEILNGSDIGNMSTQELDVLNLIIVANLFVNLPFFYVYLNPCSISQDRCINGFL